MDRASHVSPISRSGTVLIFTSFPTDSSLILNLSSPSSHQPNPPPPQPVNPTIAGRVLDMLGKANLPQKDYGLTPREKEILQHLVQGQSTEPPPTPGLRRDGS